MRSRRSPARIPDRWAFRLPSQKTAMWLLALPVLLPSLLCYAPHPQGTAFRGPYLGQDPPGLTPRIFGAGFFSSYTPVHGRITFSPDGRELYWAANAAPVQARWHMAMGGDGAWSEPRSSWLDLCYAENGLSFSSDGSRAYFHSRRSSPAGGQVGDANIWYRERVGADWGAPIPLGPSVNTSLAGERQPTLTRDGILYFTSESDAGRLGTPGRGQPPRSDIFVAHPVDGGFSEARRLGVEINSPYHEIEAAVAPDHSYLVFTSNRPGGFSPRMNLYVSFRLDDGSWTEAVSLSDVFELDNIWFPSITPDGRYLFFCDAHYTADGIVGDYYWVDTRAIVASRPVG